MLITTNKEKKLIRETLLSKGFKCKEYFMIMKLSLVDDRSVTDQLLVL